MYRKSLAMKEKEAIIESDQFLVQVGSLPVVHSAVDQLWGLYSRTKESNRLMKFTMETAERGVSVAVNTAKPVINRLPVDRLNSVACNQLGHLKDTYPVITKPVDQVWADTFHLYEATLKPTVDRVSAIKQTGVDSVSAVGHYGVNKVTGVKNYTKGVVVGAKDYGVSSLQSVKDRSLQTVASLLATSYGQLLANRIDNWVEMTDGYVEKYLPGEDEPSEKKGMEVDMAKEETTLNRVGHVSQKVGRRMLHHAMREVGHLRQRTQNLLAHLGITLELIDVAKSNLDAARAAALSQAAAMGQGAQHFWEEVQKPGGYSAVRTELLEKMNAAESRLGYIWHEIRKTEEDVGSGDDKTEFERQLIATARHLTHNLNTMCSNLLSNASMISVVFMDKVKEAGSITNALANVFASTNIELKDIPQITIDNARHQLNQLNSLMSSVAENSLNTIANSPRFSWLVPFYDFEDMEWNFGLEEDYQTPETTNGIQYVPAVREATLE